MEYPTGWNDDLAFSVSQRAYLLHTEGRYREALVLFQGLLELYPDNLYYLDAASALCLALQRPEIAVGLASEVLRRDPTHIQAYMRRCEACIALRRFSEAEANILQMRRLEAQNQARIMSMRLNASRASARNGYPDGSLIRE